MKSPIGLRLLTLICILALCDFTLSKKKKKRSKKKAKKAALEAVDSADDKEDSFSDGDVVSHPKKKKKTKKKKKKRKLKVMKNLETQQSIIAKYNITPESQLICPL